MITTIEEKAIAKIEQLYLANNLACALNLAPLVFHILFLNSSKLPTSGIWSLFILLNPPLLSTS